MGCLNYCRKLIEDFAERSTPLGKLLKKGTTWQWTDMQQKAYEDLKSALLEEPVMLYVPDLNKEFILATDALRKIAGSVICESGIEKRRVQVAHT